MAVRMLRALGGLVALGLMVPGSATALGLDQVGEFDSPTYVTSDPDDPNRLFVVEQDGRIRLTEGGVTTTFLDIDEIVRSGGEMPGGGEEGLLSMAFSADYASDDLFYVYYTNASSNLVIAEFESSGDTTDPATRRQVLEIPHPGQGNHNGGQLQLGPDGYLYAATGDGGGGNDPDDNAQDLGSLLGKVLRIDPAGETESEYTVPPDNPFADDGTCADGICDEIWSYGLRNPWRFSFDRATGALAIGDVGQSAWEEVDYRPGPNAGRRVNFGWDCREGAHPAASASAAHCIDAPLIPFTDPLFEYPQGAGRCSITGGYVVRDRALGDLYGRYLYADLCGGEIRSFCPALPAATADRSEGIVIGFPTSFGEDAAGRVYVASGGSGRVTRLTGAAAPGSCPPSPPGPPEPPGDPVDVEGPALELDAKRRADVGKSRGLKVRATVDEAAEVEVRARPRGEARRRIELEDKGAALDAGVEERIRWRLSRRERKRIRRGLRNGGDAKVRFKAEAVDATGNASERESLAIELVR
jgi:Glucose / Sorbosone dehydrogenase